MSVSQGTTVHADRQGCDDKRRLVKPKTPGVYKRVDGAGNVVGYVAMAPALELALSAPSAMLNLAD